LTHPVNILFIDAEKRQRPLPRQQQPPPQPLRPLILLLVIFDKLFCPSPFLGCEQDLVLVLDMSSTTHPIYKVYEELCEKLLNRLKIGLRYTRVALVTFNSVGGTYTHFDLDRYDNVEDVVNEIRNLVYTGGTTAIGRFIQGVKKGR
jgi:hypothetical protein